MGKWLIARLKLEVDRRERLAYFARRHLDREVIAANKGAESDDGVDLALCAKEQADFDLRLAVMNLSEAMGEQPSDGV